MLLPQANPPPLSFPPLQVIYLEVEPWWWPKQYGIKMKSSWEHLWEHIGNRPKTNKFPPFTSPPPPKPNDNGMTRAWTLGVYKYEAIYTLSIYDPVHMVRWCNWKILEFFLNLQAKSCKRQVHMAHLCPPPIMVFSFALGYLCGLQEEDFEVWAQIKRGIMCGAIGNTWITQQITIGNLVGTKRGYMKKTHYWNTKFQKKFPKKSL